jgi:2-iminobutanoate/2-iminopropanoate deaminase
MKQVVESVGPLEAAGPYSHAVRVGDFVFVAGQLPIDPLSGEVSGEDVAAQARCCLDNLETVLDAAGAAMSDVVKTTIYVTDIGQFDAVNTVYAERFEKPYPARATIQVAALPKEVLVEIDAVAHVAAV